MSGIAASPGLITRRPPVSVWNEWMNARTCVLVGATSGEWAADLGNVGRAAPSATDLWNSVIKGRVGGMRE